VVNAEYVWWVVALLLVGGGAIAFLALGRVPEIEDEPAGLDGEGQSAPVSTSVPGSDEPVVASETP
jgi:hypothetical protein